MLLQSVEASKFERAHAVEHGQHHREGLVLQFEAAAVVDVVILDQLRALLEHAADRMQRQQDCQQRDQREDLAREVIKMEKLGEKPEFDPTVNGSLVRTLLTLDPSPMSQEERTLEAFYERLNVFAIEKSRVSPSTSPQPIRTLPRASPMTWLRPI
jgi:hypothetical protein